MYISRRNVIGTLITTAAGSFSWARWAEPNLLSVTRRELEVPLLNTDLDGLRIAHLTDFHYRGEQDNSIIEQSVETIAQEKPDLIMLTGDFIDHHTRAFPELLEHLGQLKATHGIFAILGNHDGWNASSTFFKKNFEKKGISFLQNQHTILSINNTSLAVAGTDFVWLGRPDPEKTLRGIPKEVPTIALVHEPDYFDTMTLASKKIALQLSGHTHGGQCRIPLVDYTPVKVSYGEKYNYGEYSNNASKLFVSRGIGTTGIRVRFACPPEIAILTVRAKPAGQI